MLTFHCPQRCLNLFKKFIRANVLVGFLLEFFFQAFSSNHVVHLRIKASNRCTEEAISRYRALILRFKILNSTFIGLRQTPFERKEVFKIFPN